MTMKTNNDKRTARWSRQQFSKGQSTENGNHTEENQHGPTPIPPNFGLTNDTGNKCNKWIRWSKEEMKAVVWCFIYIQATTFTENYKVAYELWRERNPDLRTNIDAKLLLNQKNYISKNKKITDIEINEIKENIRHHKQDNTENNITEEENNRNLGTNEEHLENKDLREDTEQNIARDKLREELQIMWYKVRLLQMSERQRLPKLIENNKLIHLKKEINGITGELLKEDETDIKDINHLIYAAATVITERFTKPDKKSEKKRNKDS
jgi:hypothetical protein